MLESVWLFLALTALLATGAAVLTTSDDFAIIFGVAGFLAWAAVAYGALAGIEAAGSGTAYQQPGVAVLAIAFAIIPGFIALTGPTELVQRATDADTRDV